jgi:hypothetical protein
MVALEMVLLPLLAKLRPVPVVEARVPLNPPPLICTRLPGVLST